MHEPAWWAEGTEAVRQADPDIAALMDRFPGPGLRKGGDPFVVLANAVVGQQISVKAAQAIWDRIRAALAPGPVDAEGLAGLGPEKLRTTGCSGRKVEYLLGLVEAFKTGRVDPARWTAMNDDEVRKDLVSLRGVGPWTADMVLLFCLNRPDVLPLGDIALVRAASQAWEWPAEEAAARLEARARAWAPWRTVGVWYLWRTQDAEPVNY